MRARYGSAGLARYTHRFRHALNLLVGFVQRPSELSADLSMDRWLHGLYGRFPRRDAS
jgi:hypothetical protein